MKRQAIYRTSMSYFDYEERVRKRREARGVYRTEKGLISLRLGDSNEVTVQFSPLGTIQIFYSDSSELAGAILWLKEIVAPHDLTAVNVSHYDQPLNVKMDFVQSEVLDYFSSKKKMLDSNGVTVDERKKILIEIAETITEFWRWVTLAAMEIVLSMRIKSLEEGEELTEEEQVMKAFRELIDLWSSYPIEKLVLLLRSCKGNIAGDIITAMREETMKTLTASAQQ